MVIHVAFFCEKLSLVCSIPYHDGCGCGCELVMCCVSIGKVCEHFMRDIFK